MKKIPTIFKRNPEKMSEVLEDKNNICQWVFDGEGNATRKYDGTCCCILNGDLYRRREIKNGGVIPDGFIQADFDEITGKTFGWVKCDRGNKADKYHFEAFDKLTMRTDGTYELLGPKIQGNPEHECGHFLLRHQTLSVMLDVPREYQQLKQWFLGKDVEGIVWHHPDGRMAKIKKRDFGLKRVEKDSPAK